MGTEFFMHDRGIVVEIDNDIVMIKPLLTDTCISCSNAKSCGGSCAKEGESFPVNNRKKLPIKVGSIVKVKASPLHQSIQAIGSLIFPIACAVAGFIIASKLSDKESIAALGVLLGIVFSATIVITFNKTFGKHTGEIVEIYD